MKKSFQSLLGLMLLPVALATAAQITNDDYLAVNSSHTSNEIKIKGKEQAALNASKKCWVCFAAMEIVYFLVLANKHS
jgi:hypothetical protein